VVLAVFAAAAAVAAFALLPADGLFSSDEGVKLIQLESLVRNRLADARLAWPGDALGLDRRYIYVERFFEESGGNLYTPHPLLLALATAPFRLAFGLRGIYLWPVVAGVAAVGLAMALARRFGARRPWLAGLTLAFASPIFFYSCCYWEHTPAVALWLAGFYLLGRRTAARLLAAGALWGLGAALRPEFWWLAVWAAAAAFMKGERVKTALVPAAAFLVVAVGLELLFAAVWHQPAFMRFGANVAYAGRFGPAGILYAVKHSWVPLAPWYLGAAFAAAAALALAGWKWRPAAYAAALAALPLAFLYRRVFDGYATAVAASFPAAFALALLARPAARRAFAGASSWEKTFYLASGGFAATLFLVVPDTSGFSWGPRFLLCAIPAGAVALARLADGLVGDFRRARWVPAAVLAAAVATSAWAQSWGWARLWGTRQANHELVAAFEALAPAPVLVDKWHLPMSAAPLFTREAFAIVEREEELPAILAALAGRGVRRAYFMTELPPDAAEAEYFKLGLTSMLARYAEVTDLAEVAPEARRHRYAFPYGIWTLAPAPPGEAAGTAE